MTFIVEFDDDTLIALIRKGDTHAEVLLCAKYFGFASILGKKFYSLYRDLGFSLDEFTQVAFVSVAIALKKYKLGTDQSFHSYWHVIAKNQCINFIHQNSFIDYSHNRPISLDSTYGDDGLSLHETCGSIDHKISFDVTHKQLYDFIVSEKSSLTVDEKVVAYYMFLENYDYDDLIAITKWRRDKVYRTVRKARKKVSNFFKSGYFK